MNCHYSCIITENSTFEKKLQVQIQIICLFHNVIYGDAIFTRTNIMSDENENIFFQP